MTGQVRTFVTTAIQVAILIMTWVGRIEVRIIYLDKIHRTEKGVEHLWNFFWNPRVVSW